MKTILMMAAGLAAAVGAANAADKPAPAATDPHVGEQVDQICFIGNINGWRALKGDDHAVLLEKNVHDWYRAEVTGVCASSDFKFAEKIALESPTGGCLTKGDAIIVRGAGDMKRRCIITRLNKWNENPATAAAKRGKD